MTSESKGSWWCGQDDEYFTAGPFEDREEAILDGTNDYGGDPFFIINAEQHSVKFYAKRVINDYYFDNDMLFDYDREEPDRVGSKEVIEAADKALQVLLDSWLELYGHTFKQPNMFAWHSTAERIVPELLNIEKTDSV